MGVSGSDGLSYHRLAESTTEEDFFTDTVSRLSGATSTRGKLWFRFRIGGTINSPVFFGSKGDKDVDAVIVEGRWRVSLPAA